MDCVTVGQILWRSQDLGETNSAKKGFKLKQYSKAKMKIQIYCDSSWYCNCIDMTWHDLFGPLCAAKRNRTQKHDETCATGCWPLLTFSITCEHPRCRCILQDWMYDMKKDDAKQNAASGCSMVRPLRKRRKGLIISDQSSWYVSTSESCAGIHINARNGQCKSEYINGFCVHHT